METPYFEHDIKAYMQWLLINNPDSYVFVATQMWKPKDAVKPFTSGSCTSSNCFGTTGCHKATQNGECECAGPNGPCVWVPAT